MKNSSFCGITLFGIFCHVIQIEIVCHSVCKLLTNTNMFIYMCFTNVNGGWDKVLTNVQVSIKISQIQKIKNKKNEICIMFIKLLYNYQGEWTHY